METITVNGLTMTVAQDQLGSAVASAQAMVGTAAKNRKNGHLRSRYADLESVIAAVKPALAANGLACPMMPITEPGRAGIRWVLMHKSGQWMSGECWHDRGNAKGLTPAQADGVCHSYARRYALSALFLVATGDDVDGDIQPGTASPPARQAKPGRAAGTGRRIDRRKTHPDAWSGFIKALAEHEIPLETLDAWLVKNGRPRSWEVPDDAFSKMCNWAISPAGRKAILGGNDGNE